MNQKSFHYRFLSLLLCLALLFSGCGQKNPGTEPTPTPELPDYVAMFDEFTDELFHDEIVLNTVNLHYTLAHPENYGIEDYEVTLGSFTMEELEKTCPELEELKEELLTFDKEYLTKEQKLTYDIILDYAETELSVKDLLLYTELLGPTTGYQAQLPVVLAEYGFRTKCDIDDYLILLSQMDELFADIIAFEEKKSEAGLFMADSTADAIIDQCSAFIEEPENNYMIELFDDYIAEFDWLTEEERTAYSERNYTLVTTDVVNGYQSIIDGLTALKGTGTNDKGLCYYEDGRQYYEYLVRVATGSDNTVPKLQSRTKEYIQNCLNEMSILLQKQPGLYDAMYDYSFCETEPEAVLKDLVGKIAEEFPEPPAVNYTVKQVHPSMEEHMSPAFYLTPPIDDVQNNVIYINPKYENPYIYTTLAHEGYPGHLYQQVYTNAKGLPLVRNLFSFSGYTEGWATYAEYESYAYTGIDPDLARLLRLNGSATLGLYAVIDMGIHYDGWSVDDVHQYLSGFGITDAGVAQEMFDIMLEDPANYLSYFIGYLEFLKLREAAEQQLGDAFSAKEFHDFVLSIGPAPFYIIEDYMDDWILEQKAE